MVSLGGSIDTDRIEAAVRELLSAIGEDVDRPGLADTPHRVGQAYAEFFSGLAVDPLTHLQEPVGVAGVVSSPSTLGEVVLVRDIDFRSICEHHLLPFLGVAHVAYMPGEKIVGLGDIAKVVDTLASRPQLQERLTEEVTDALQTGLVPEGVLVVMDAVHGCVSSRGVRHTRSSTVTLASRGTLSDPVRRAEVMAMIGSKGDY
ncbi:MAG: folE [Homoserinimonas sp.]|nr:folE [Homoserinimonas sp.]